MTMSDTLGDMLTRIRNGQRANLLKVETPASKKREDLLKALEREGFIGGYSRIDHGHGKADLVVELKYYNGEPVIREIKRVSKPGRRVYTAIKDLKQISNGLGVSIISTPKGVLSDNEARKENVGGEVLCSVF